MAKKTKIPSKKKPDKLITFPCDFPIKIMSKSDFDLESFVTHVVHKHSLHMEHIPINKTSSKQGNYQAVTVVIKAINQPQLDAIYLELTADPAVIMVL